MIRLRVTAACAAIITALLIQATLISPLSLTLQVSLPAVLVCAVALVEGPGTGIAFGFSAGLVADLASTHPAGVLALTWLAMALLVGAVGSRAVRPMRRRRSVFTDALWVGFGCGVGAVLTTVVLLVVHADGAIAYDLVLALPSATFDAVLALFVVPVVRSFLSSNALRVPRPVMTDIDVRPSGV